MKSPESLIQKIAHLKQDIYWVDGKPQFAPTGDTVNEVIDNAIAIIRQHEAEQNAGADTVRGGQDRENGQKSVAGANPASCASPSEIRYNGALFEQICNDLECEYKKTDEHCRFSDVGNLRGYIHLFLNRYLESSPTREYSCRDALQNIMNGIESGAIRIKTDQDETLANAIHQATEALKP